MGSELVLYVFVGALGLCIGLAVLMAILFSHDRRVKRTIRKAIPTTIGAATPGTLARLTGAIEPLEERLTAPISGRECTYYLAILQVYRSSGRQGSWVEAVREEKGADFMLRDATGAVQVHMRGAEIAIVRDHHTTSGTFDAPSAIEAAFLERYRMKATTLLGFNMSYRYIEGVLEFGEQVGVLGTVQYAEGERSLHASSETAVLVSDDPSTLAPRT